MNYTIGITLQLKKRQHLCDIPSRNHVTFLHSMLDVTFFLPGKGTYDIDSSATTMKNANSTLERKVTTAAIKQMYNSKLLLSSWQTKSSEINSEKAVKKFITNMHIVL